MTDMTSKDTPGLFYHTYRNGPPLIGRPTVLSVIGILEQISMWPPSNSQDMADRGVRMTSKLCGLVPF